MSKPTNFYGKWVFQPEQANYELGAPPKEGRYEVRQEGNVLRFIMDWVDSTDKSFHMIYETIPDGAAHPYENPAMADTVTTTLIDANTLDSVTRKGEAILVSARRTLSQDGKVMEVSMSGNKPDGSNYVNRSVYLKVSD
jgi:hypothetical protein